MNLAVVSTTVLVAMRCAFCSTSPLGCSVRYLHSPISDPCPASIPDDRCILGWMARWRVAPLVSQSLSPLTTWTVVD
ncbi:hypothetical protein B0J13DRAFT_552021 [Dactylonectria estremocensis]|uniref:Secreted protein n=1 Tax=Dactylonectria estremocensis TaxID=1079267 RepID=A0A9P9F1T0_9HYPO|nr:hypothetical protein B0J13DRAFT_552021 [Dactylonectria estremocensis]